MTLGPLDVPNCTLWIRRLTGEYPDEQGGIYVAAIKGVVEA